MSKLSSQTEVGAFALLVDIIDSGVQRGDIQYDS
jgi:hypothetical protein